MDGNFLATLLQGIAGAPQAAQAVAPPWPTPWLDNGQGAPASPMPTRAPNPGLGDLDAILKNLPDPVVLSASAPQTNVLQAAAAPPDMPQPAPTPAAPEKAAEAPRPRHSLLDTLGRVSDALARFGGAEPGYQTSLDAQDARKNAVINTGLQRQITEQQIATGADEATTRHNVLVGTAVRALQAIRRAQPNADINTVWPLLARQAGIPDDQAARLSEIFATHPEAVDGIAAITNGRTEYNGNVIYARGPDGRLAAFQPSNSNTSEARNILPPNFTPVDPLTFVNTGNAQVGVGRNSATPQIILPVSEAPGHAADRAERRYESDTGHATTITVAGMPARERAAANAHTATDPTNGLTLLNNIENAFGQLHRMNALPGDDGGTVSNITGALGRTHLGQAIGEQAGSPAAQMRLEIGKNVSALQQEMLRSLPASATRTRFEQEMLARGLPDPARMSYSTARTVIGQLRESYTRALAVAQRQAQGGGNSRPAAPVQPRTGGGTGRGVVAVQSPAEAARLAPGTRFRTPDGQIRVRN